MFSLVLKVAEKLHFWCFSKGEGTIFAWTQDLFSLDGRVDNSKHIGEKKMKKKVAPAKVMIDLNGSHPTEYRKYSWVNMTIYDFTRQIWKFLRAITFAGAYFFYFFFRLIFLE